MRPSAPCRRAALAAATLLATSCARRGDEPPSAALAPAPDASRFQQQVLLEGVFDEPTEIAVAGDGRVFVTERKGVVRLHDPTAAGSRVVARLDVYTEHENGLLGIALDPGFDRNRWLYVARTVGDTAAARHRVSRFTFAGDSLGGERVLLEVPITRDCCHTGGSMAFDARA